MSSTPQRTGLKQPRSPEVVREWARYARTGPETTAWSDAGVSLHLSELAADPDAVGLVADLVSGARASFTVAEAAAFLSVSAKHLYAVIAATGEVCRGVGVIRSGDRMMIPAHELRAFLRLPDPHRLASPEADELTVERFRDETLGWLAESIAHALMLRLDTVGVLELPEVVDE